jgi:hypothetical protein
MQRIHFLKKWIVKQFIAEYDLSGLPAVYTIAWGEAFKELSQHVSHQVVPFRRGSREA